MQLVHKTAQSILAHITRWLSVFSSQNFFLSFFGRRLVGITTSCSAQEESQRDGAESDRTEPWRGVVTPGGGAGPQKSSTGADTDAVPVQCAGTNTTCRHPLTHKILSRHFTEEMVTGALSPVCNFSDAD